MTEPRASAIERLHGYLAQPRSDPSLWFAKPLDVVESGGAYEQRLEALQNWLAFAHRRQDKAMVKAIEGAILALEQGAAIGHDEPEGAPPGWGYGASET